MDNKELFKQMIADGVLTQEVAARYCPELIEDEDERIRGYIICILYKYIFYFDDKIAESDTKTRLVNKAKECIAWLEKQGEKGVNGNERKIPFSEQKPAEKVEPKFHKGEWLCENKPNNYARFIQILEIVNVQGEDRYRISRDIHKDEDIVEFDFVEKYYHKFNIKDAKGGDVLCSNQIIILFKQWEDSADCNFVIAHAGIDVSGKLQITDGHWLINNNSHPATKEQRDLLFQKMKEAGYNWDAEKKELKRIEQNAIEPDDLIEESYQQQANDLIDMVTEKPAWSEEDEISLSETVAIINRWIKDRENDGFRYKDTEIGKQSIDWLKSLRHRNTWKPSDKQMHYLSWIANVKLGDSVVEQEVSKHLNELLEDLKKLTESSYGSTREDLSCNRPSVGSMSVNYNRNDTNNIEYTRTDAFIEKAVKWIKEAITNNPKCNRIISKKGIITMGELIEDFKKYMKEG